MTTFSETHSVWSYTTCKTFDPFVLNQTHQTSERVAIAITFFWWFYGVASHPYQQHV